LVIMALLANNILPRIRDARVKPTAYVW